MFRCPAVCALAVAAPGFVVAAPTKEFTLPMPPLNTESFFDSGFIPDAPEFAAGTVIDARVELSITVDPLEEGDTRNNGAEFFFTEIVFPVDTDPEVPGIQAFAGVIDGAAEGWSGTGTLTISRSIPELIGGEFVVPLLFTAITSNGNGSDSIVNLAESLNADIPFTVDDAWLITVEAIPSPGAVAVFGVAG